MSVRVVRRWAPEAKWSLRVALFSAQLLILAALLHRFASLGTPAAMNVMLLALLGCGIATLLAMIAVVRIWRRGRLGAGQAFAGIFIALVALALPLYYLPSLILLPHLTDIATAPEEPPAFATLASARPADANPLQTPTEESAELQTEAYPDIRPMQLERPARAVYDMVVQAVDRLGWKVVKSESPKVAGVGSIEATDRTLLMGFTDDVAIRVSGDDAHATIDVRSASRYGLHDFGTNADRIRALFAEVKAELAKGETTGLEQIAAASAKTEAAEKETKDAKTRKKRSAGGERRRSSRYRARSNARDGRKQRERPRTVDRYRDPDRSWSPFFQ